MEANYPKTHGGDLIYLLSWHDVLERLDTLILEVRHLQVSILSHLREPDFYRNLRYEERFLWGGKWCETRDEGGVAFQRHSVNDLVNSWVLNYPLPSEIGKSIDISVPDDLISGAEWKPIVRKQKERLREIWLSSEWNRDQRRHYHTLCGLQQLKRRIFRDKLVLCKLALSLRLHEGCESVASQGNKAGFLVARAGALRNIGHYIHLLRNFQSAFNKSMDTGVQDSPRPSIERRRELGIYMDYLSERSRDILRDMGLLLKYLGAKQEYNRTRVIYHRWRHSYRSTTQEIGVDIVSRTSEGHPLSSTMRFVNTSYFMPERPDLQPVIAHEVAHAHIRDQYDNFTGVSLGVAEDCFADLMVRIETALTDFRILNALPRTDVSVTDLTREIACDLLAASVKGYAYVYSLFLESVGYGSELLLKRRNEEIDLETVYEVAYGPPKAALSRAWSLRIMITLHWLRKIHHLPGGDLGELLLGGVERVLIDLNSYLDELIRHSDSRRGMMWSRLTERLCEIIDSSKVKGRVKTWRTMRSEDEYKSPSSEADERRSKENKGNRRLPRSMAPIHHGVRDWLFFSQVNKKGEEGRRLHERLANKKGDEKIELFYDAFGVVPLDGRYKYCDESKEARTLFRHIYDISWQAGIMRAMEIFGGVNGVLSDRKGAGCELVSELHQKFALGRVLFACALEYYLWSSESAPHRLAALIDLLQSKLDTLECLMQRSNDDGSGAFSFSPDSLSGLRRDVQVWVGDYSPAIRSKTEPSKLDVSKEYSARFLLHRYKTAEPFDSSEYRKVEKLSGLALHRLYKKLCAIGDESLKAYFHDVIVYLSTRSPEGRPEFMEMTCASLANCKRERVESDKYSAKLRSVMLGRIVMNGLYPSYPDLRMHKKVRDVHLEDVCGAEEVDGRTEGAVHVLGWFDGVGVREVSPICRCPLIRFMSDEGFQGAGAALNEFFPPLLVRREMALAAHFFPASNSSSEVDEGKKFIEGRDVIAVSAITLQRRQYRLDFVYRLLKSLVKNLPTDSGPFARAAHSAIKKNDSYYLTDGWGDLVLVFTRDEKGAMCGSRLDDLMRFQAVMLQDFMVDHADLMFAPVAFDCALSENMKRKKSSPGADDKWRLGLKVRLVEERNGCFALQQFCDYFHGKGADIDADDKKDQNEMRDIADIRLSIAPGRAGCVIDIVVKQDLDQNATCPPDAYQKMLKFIHPKYMDRVDTSVSFYDTDVSRYMYPGITVKSAYV